MIHTIKLRGLNLFKVSIYNKYVCQSFGIDWNSKLISRLPDRENCWILELFLWLDRCNLPDLFFLGSLIHL